MGPVNAENISATGWVRQRGMMFSSHHDAPVAFPDSMRILSATVTRRTRSGDILGPHQRVDVMTALKAMTIWPAWQHFEEDNKGSIEPGKLADFVILSDDPTAVDPSDLANLKVMTTIKQGSVVYAAGGRDDSASLGYRPASSGDDPFAGMLRQVAIAQSSGGRGFGPVPPWKLANAPHSSACVAGTLAGIIGAAQVRLGSPRHHKKRPLISGLMAERGGFEPPKGLSDP